MTSIERKLTLLNNVMAAKELARALEAAYVAEANGDVEVAQAILKEYEAQADRLSGSYEQLMELFDPDGH